MLILRIYDISCSLSDDRTFSVIQDEERGNDDSILDIYYLSYISMCKSEI